MSVFLKYKKESKSAFGGKFRFRLYNTKFLVTFMLVTDVYNSLCCLKVWDVDPFELMVTDFHKETSLGMDYQQNNSTTKILKLSSSYSQQHIIVTNITVTVAMTNFSEVCSTWKDGCIAFSSEHIQISKYYLDGPDSKPYQKCKVINLMDCRYFLLSDSHRLIVQIFVMWIV